MKRALFAAVFAAIAACAPYHSHDLDGGIPIAYPATFSAVPVAASSTASSAQLPYVEGFSGQILVPPGTGTASVIVSLNPAAGVPPLQTAGSIFPFVYITIRAESALTLSAMPAFNLTLPQNDATGVYYLSMYSGGKWTGTSARGWGSTTQPVACFTSAGAAVKLQPGESLYLGVWTDAVLPTPTPAPLGTMPCPQTL